MQNIRKDKLLFGRNLYDTDETNSILEIRLNFYCPVFEEIKSSFLNVADFFKSSCSDTSHFGVSLILYCLQWRYQNKNIMMRSVKLCIEVGME